MPKLDKVLRRIEFSFSVLMSATAIAVLERFLSPFGLLLMFGLGAYYGWRYPQVFEEEKKEKSKEIS